MTRIFGCIRSFVRLEALTLKFGNIPVDLCDLWQLPGLKQLTIHCCALPQAMPAIQNHLANITDLQLFNVVNYPYRWTPGSAAASMYRTEPVSCAEFFSRLPGLRTLQVDASFLQTPFLPTSNTITSLTITVPRRDVYIANFLAILRSMPALEHLATFERQIPSNQDNHLNHLPPLNQPVQPALAHLTRFSGPGALGILVLSNAPVLEDVCINDTTTNPVEFVEFLQHRQAPVRRLRIKSYNWGREIVETLRAIAYCLPLCEHIELTYSKGRPAEV